MDLLIYMKPDRNIDQLGPTKSLFKFGFVKEFSPITRKALIEPIAKLIDKGTELTPSFKMLLSITFTMTCIVLIGCWALSGWVRFFFSAH